MFKTGDLVVYPSQGVGVIEAIETKEVGGQKQEFFIVRILENDMIIMVPINNASNVGLRPIIKKEEVPQVISELKKFQMSTDAESSWNRRYKDMVEQLKTGSIYDVAKVVKALVSLKKEKELSFGEKKLLERAQSLLVKELSIAENCPEQQVYAQLKEVLHI